MNVIEMDNFGFWIADFGLMESLQAWGFALRATTPHVASGLGLRPSGYDPTRRPDRPLYL